MLTFCPCWHPPNIAKAAIGNQMNGRIIGRLLSNVCFIFFPPVPKEE